MMMLMTMAGAARTASNGDDSAAAAALLSPTSSTASSASSLWLLYGDVIVGVLFCAGIALSYVPQHVQCCRYRSSDGLSLATILVATLSCWSLLFATLLHDLPRLVVFLSGQCQHPQQQQQHLRGVLFGGDDVSGSSGSSSSHSSHCWLEVLNGAMPSIQNLVGIVTGTPIYVLYYFAYSHNGNRNRNIHNNYSTSPLLEEEERAPAESDDERQQQQRQRKRELRWTLATWTVVFLALVWSTAVLLVDIALLSKPEKQQDDGAAAVTAIATASMEFFGIAAAVTNAIQWMPQIHTTYRNRHEGVLSVSALLLAVAGDGLQGLYWRQSSHREPVYVTLTLACDASLQLCLIGLVWHFRRQRRRRQQQQSRSTVFGRDGEADDDGNDDPDFLDAPFLPFLLLLSPPQPPPTPLEEPLLDADDGRVDSNNDNSDDDADDAGQK
jgi:uncharacterized protein with PQ loop repeat/cbb3-type cytochrome oxidase subunit 3